MLFPAIAQAADSIIAEPSQMSYMPFTLWVLVTGISLVIVIVILCTYLFYQKFLKAFGDNALSFADLAAQKEQVEAEIEQCRMWLQDNREELLKQDAQRREQELLLLDLKRLQMESAQTEQRRDDLRKEASDLQNVVSTLVQDRDRLLAEKGTLEGEKTDAEVATRGAEEARQLADTAAQHAEQGLRTLEVRYTDEKKRVDILVQEIADKEVRHHTLTHAITALTETRAAWQDELLTLEVERREQEDLRKRLEELRRELVQQEDAMHSVRKEASELQGAVTTLREARARLEAEKVDLDKAKAAAETAANDADEARQRAVNAAKQSAEELQSLRERSQEEQQNRNGMLRDICDKEIKLQSLMQENTAFHHRTLFFC